MAHQFLCPRGHLLQADESAGGAQCKCPHCGVLFIIPPPAGAATSVTPEPPHVDSAADDAPIAPLWETDPTEQLDATAQLGFSIPEDEPEEDPEAVVEAEADPVIETFVAPAAPDELLAVVCPKGHRLQAPRKTLGEEVLCTVCRRRFLLTREHTWEYLTQKAELNALRQRRLERMWLNWAITAAVLVVGALVALMVISKYR